MEGYVITAQDAILNLASLKALVLSVCRLLNHQTRGIRWVTEGLSQYVVLLFLINCPIALIIIYVRILLLKLIQHWLIELLGSTKSLLRMVF